VNIKQISQLTIGFWQNLYKGELGRLAAGAQLEYFHRTVFPALLTTVGGPLVAPVNDEVMVMTSLRYYFP
jgi:hypothetical protein